MTRSFDESEQAQGVPASPSGSTPSGQAPTGLVGSAGTIPNAAREAQCPYCRKRVPSNPALPFFEDRGAGSKEAEHACRICKCFQVAHHPRGDDAPEAMRGKIPSIIGKPHAFEPHGPWEFDSFYCGCRGWE